MAEDAAVGTAMPTIVDEQRVEAGFPVRFPEFRCIVCGTEQFFVVDDLPRAAQTEDLYKDAASQHSKTHLNTLTIACLECGHTYQFLEALLLRTIENGRSSDEDRSPP